MRRLLMVAYHFPPVGGAGVQRAVKLARYLPAAGWEPAVLTGPGARAGRWTPSDSSLELDVPSALPLRRVAGPEPTPPGRWRGRAERWLRVQGAWEQWWERGLADAGSADDGSAEAILVTMSPFQSAAAVARLAAGLGLPWVADLRDPWALDEMTVYPTRVHRWREARDMRRALASAAAIVMNTPEAALCMRSSFPELAARVVDPIPNGFDPADFGRHGPPGDEGPYRIVHAGYLHTALRQTGPAAAMRRFLEGRSFGQVDRGARSVVHLLASISAASPHARRPIELHLAGVLTADDRAAIPAEITVRDHGYLSHADSVALMESAHLLFLPMHDMPVGRRATIVPGKTYEYLASGRPILAAVPDGDARDLLAAAPGVRICRPTDRVAMAAALAAEMDAKGRDYRAARTELLTPFRRSELACRMGAVLDAVASSPAAVAVLPPGLPPSDGMPARLATPPS